MFDLKTGSFRTLEEACVSDILEARRRESLAPLLVVSPSGHILTRLQTQLCKAPHPALLNIHFLTFYALAERVLADSGYTERVVTEPALYNEIIREILSGPHPEPVDLAIRKSLHREEGKAVPKGLAGALAATIKDLRDAGMRADRALKAAQEGFLGEEAPEAASTLALYARMIGLFEKRNLRSSADLLRRTALAVPENTWFKSQRSIFLYGFYDLTGVQLDLVMAMADHSNARVYFPYQDGHPAYAYAEKLLKDPAFTSKCTSGRAEERRSGRNVFSSAPPLLRSPAPTVEVWSCSGARDEVWQAAKTILRLTDEGMAFTDIAVIARNLSPYAAALRETFGAHEIPFVSTRSEPAGAHPLLKTIHALLAFDPTHPQAKTLQKDLERSPYLTNFAPTPGNESAPWSTHIDWAKHLLNQSIRLPKHASPEETDLLESVLAALDELRILDSLGNHVTRRHSLDTFFEKLESLERPSALRPHAGVQVLEVQQARGLSFKAVILLGMNEKVFPRLIREDPFLSGAARSALAQATGCRLGRKLDGYEEERMLFELMRQAAGQSLTLLTQRSDEEGKALIPSVYLKEMEHAVPGLKVQRLPRSMPEKFENRNPMGWTPKELSQIVNRAHLDPKAIYQALGWNTGDFYRLLANHRALETFSPVIGAHDGAISDLSLLKKALERPFSPSALEDLAECPFLYYAGHVLGIPEPEELAPEGELTPKALGQLFHKTLEFFFTACQEGGLPQKPNDLQKRLSAAVDATFGEFEANLSTVYPLQLKSSKEIIFKELSEFLKTDIEELESSGFRPQNLEKALEGPLAATTLPYRFYGRPDRLDVKDELGRTRIRVVDYKSGKPKSWTGRLETHIIQGKFLQLPIYLGLAKAESATLRPVRGTDLEATEKTLQKDFWESPSATLFAENIQELIKLIEQGKFYIEPSTGEWGYCGRCSFALACRKEHMPTRLRAEKDAARNRVKEKLARTAPK